MVKRQVIFDSSLVDEINYDELNKTIEIISNYFNKCLITGVLGLWDGQHEIVPVAVNSFENAVGKCLNNIDSFSITIVGKRVDIKAIHHDGTNNFSLYFLSELGSERYCRNGKVSIKNRENLLDIPKDVYLL